MVDAVRVDARNIPPATVKVAGYATGSGVVPWTAAEWALFPRAAHIRIDQSPAGAVFAAGGADVYDMEYLAGQPQYLPSLARQRIRQGIAWSTSYGTDGTLAEAASFMASSGIPGWEQHADCWLADWNLDEDQAATLLGTQLHGMTVRAVQWASPSSNPATILPGSALTLAQANVDLSVAEDGWHSPGGPPPAPDDWTEDMIGNLPDVGYGAQGDVVRTVQGLCCARGYTITVDGNFGPVTQGAVKTLQARHGLTADGIVGQLTWPVLVTGAAA